MGSQEEFYTEQQAEEILRRAAGDQFAGGMSRDRLLQSAAELGIPPEAVERAEQAVTAESQLAVDRKRFLEHRKRRIGERISSWVGTAVLLMGINFLSLGGNARWDIFNYWSLYFVAFVGLVGIKDLVELLFTSRFLEEEEFQKWRRMQEPRPDMTSAMQMVASEIPPDQKLMRIKRLREVTNLGLKEAKDAVEEYEMRFRA